MSSRTVAMGDTLLPTSIAVSETAPGAPSEAVASWSAIFAGAFVAVSASLILLTLGAGLGLHAGTSAVRMLLDTDSLTINAAIWLIATQWISAGLGGYIAGRLRRRWQGTHAHEVFFRDTAHGLVTWSVATVWVSAMLSASLLHGASIAAPAAAAAVLRPNEYDTERLFRANAETKNAANAVSGAQTTYVQAVATRIAVNAVETGSMPEADRLYLQQLVIANTGLSPLEAQQRVSDYLAHTAAAVATYKANAEVARNAASQAAIYMALSLLVGAFVASVSAALGGHLRDEHP